MGRKRQKCELAKRQIEALICALNDAISDGESFAGCHEEYDGKPMNTWEDIHARTEGMIKRYKKLRRDLMSFLGSR